MKFSPAISDDLPRIAEWIGADPSKRDTPAEWFLTGTECIFAACVEDQSGPVMYVKLIREGSLARLHTLFIAPETAASKRRIVSVMLEGFPKLVAVLGEQGLTGIVFESISESLVAFMTKFGFKHADQNDYELMFPVIEPPVASAEIS